MILVFGSRIVTSSYDNRVVLIERGSRISQRRLTLCPISGNWEHYHVTLLNCGASSGIAT